MAYKRSSALPDETICKNQMMSTNEEKKIMAIDFIMSKASRVIKL